jgi:UDP-3-O-[3-hydroxymyristoyl] glucosamine N-acyltransferase
MKALTAILGLLLLSACSTAKYEVNSDGSRPVLYPAAKVVKWQDVDGAHQSPSGDARIYIDPTVEFDKGVQLGDGVRIGARSFIDEDVVLFPNVTVGEGTKIGGDAIVQGDVKIGSKVVIGGDSKIGARSVIEDGATLGKWVRIGK